MACSSERPNWFLTCAQDVLQAFGHGASVYSLIWALILSSNFSSNLQEKARQGINPEPQD